MNVDERAVRKISKFLSLVLRHNPDRIGIVLDEAGWTDVDALLIAMQKHGQRLSQELLNHVVESNDKQRFQFSENGRQIRATQGHSVDVELGYQPAPPPEVLRHGTPEKFVDAIRRTGLQKMSRHHVHLHCDAELAATVGSRRGSPVLLSIRAREMAEAGYEFFVTPNQVWLTDHVPPEFIEFPGEYQI